jgi:hypothetical protein
MPRKNPVAAHRDEPAWLDHCVKRLEALLPIVGDRLSRQVIEDLIAEIKDRLAFLADPK